jgi:fucose permease
MNKRSKFQLLLLLIMNYFTFALITNIPGVLLPLWKDCFHLSSAIVSFLGSAFFLAYGLTSLPLGYLNDNIGSKKIFLLGISFILLGSLTFALFPVFSVGLTSLFIIGIGVTALQLVGNLLVKKVDDNPAKYSRNLTLTQVFCGIGGAGGGFLIGYLVKNLGFGWQSIYFIFAGLALLLGLFVLITKIPETASDADYVKPTKNDYFTLAKNPLMLIFAMGIFIYVGIEVGIATWISTFLHENHGIDILKAAQVVSLYWIFQSIGRFMGGFVLNYMPTPKALVLYSLAALSALIVAVNAYSFELASISFITVGFFTSIMFPCVFSLAVNSFDKREEGTVAGILCTAIVGGAATAPFIGYIAKLTNSLGTGLVVASAISFLYLAFVGIKSLREQTPAVSKSLPIDESKESATV